MSKELDAYRRLCSHLDYDNDDYMFNGNYEEDNEVLEKALTENDELRTRNYELLKESENFYNERNEYKRALKIIKEKNVKIDVLKYQSDVVFYNMAVFEKEEKLTQDEFNFLKEVLL